MAWKLISLARNYRRALSNLALLATTIIVLLLLFEVVLRLWPDMLGQEFANSVMTRYTLASDGIFYHDPSLKMNFMKPNFETENYWNGYRWYHQTDELGFRNAQTRT